MVSHISPLAAHLEVLLPLKMIFYSHGSSSRSPLIDSQMSEVVRRVKDHVESLRFLGPVVVVLFLKVLLLRF